MSLLRTVSDSTQFPAQAVIPHGRAMNGLNPFIGPNHWIAGTTSIAPGVSSIVLTPTLMTRCIRIAKMIMHAGTSTTPGGWTITFNPTGTQIFAWIPTQGDVITLDFLPCGIASVNMNDSIMFTLHVLTPGNSVVSWIILYTEETLNGQFDGED